MMNAIQNMIILLLACTKQCVFESVGPWCPLLCLRLQESWSKSRSYCEKLDHSFPWPFSLLFPTAVGQMVKMPPPQWKVSWHISACTCKTEAASLADWWREFFLGGGEKTFQLMMCKSLSQMSIQFLTCVKIYTWLKVTRVSDLPATGGGNCPITFLQPLPLI